jgi:hypothetical protein
MWKLGLRPPNSFLGIFVSNFRHCAFAVYDLGYLSARDPQVQVEHGTNVKKDNHAFLPSLELAPLLRKMIDIL